MATINYSIQGKSNPVKIFLRFSYSRGADFSRGTNLIIMREHWNPKTQRVRDVIACQNRELINQQLAKLEIFIIDEFNVDFMKGEIIDGNWLTTKISKFFNRPKQEVKLKNDGRNIYLTDFADSWLDEKAPTWKVKAGKYMDDKTIGHYKILNDHIKKFEGKDKIRMKNLTSEVLDKFSEFLSAEGYATLTTKRMIGRFRFFCNRAEEMNIEINKGYKERVFVADEAEDYKKAYLNEWEIERMFKHDFSYSKELDEARDNFVIACLSGLRVSDFLRRLDVSNFSEGYISIKTQKTGANVVIPVHRFVEAILLKRNGQLPAKISDQKFNKRVKQICQVLEFDEMMMGGVVEIDPKTKIKRKVVKLYPKYKLISSHTGRRSFATNQFGKIPNKSLMDVCGWKSENQMLEYLQQSNMDAAKELKAAWEKQLK